MMPMGGLLGNTCDGGCDRFAQQLAHKRSLPDRYERYPGGTMPPTNSAARRKWQLHKALRRWNWLATPPGHVDKLAVCAAGRHGLM
jgi:hypothetical protein